MVKYLVILLAVAAWGQDLTSLYREHGVKAVQQYLDSKLTEPEYWQEQLESKDTRFGYFENTSALLNCDKNQSMLRFYRQDENGTYILQNSFGAYTGKANGDKFKEGDLKTPVGVYRLTQRLNQVDPFYGPMAFVTSYPNFFDKIQGKNGSGIWIHGLPADAARDPYTRGCIAIENDDLQCLDQALNYQQALLIIDEQLEVKTSKETLATILSQLYRWRYAWIYNDLESYLSFYSDAFRRFDGMTYEAFARYKRRVFAKNEPKEIDFNNIAILPYPGNGGSLYVIYFDETYRSPSYSFEGKKGLMITLTDQTIRIVAEQ